MLHSLIAQEFITEQTPEVCLEAVRQNGLALKFVEKQTPEILFGCHPK